MRYGNYLINYAINRSFDDVTFLYPDMVHGIQGRFDRRGVLIAGKRVKVIAERTDGYGIKELTLSQPLSSAIKSDISTKKKLASHPMERDPYEATMVDVQRSKIGMLFLS